MRRGRAGADEEGAPDGAPVRIEFEFLDDDEPVESQPRRQVRPVRQTRSARSAQASAEASADSLTPEPAAASGAESSAADGAAAPARVAAEVGHDAEGDEVAAEGRPPRSLRFRLTVLGGVLVLAAGGLGVGWAVRAAQRRAQDEFTVVAVRGSFQPSALGIGLDLALQLEDRGPQPVSLLAIEIDQPGLALAFPSAGALPMKVGTPMAIVLNGQYDCIGDDAVVAHTFELAVQVRTGAVENIVVALPTTAVLPDGWRTDRETFCRASGGGLPLSVQRAVQAQEVGQVTQPVWGGGPYNPTG